MRNKLTLSLIICGLPLIPIVYFFRELPNKMVVHMNNGSPDIFLNKYLATFGLVFFCMILQVINFEFKYKSKEGLNKILDLVRLFGIPIIANLLMISILNFSLKGTPLSVDEVSVVGLILIVLSVLILAFKINFLFPNQWKKCEQRLDDSVSRFAAFLYFCSGLFMIFMNPSVAFQIVTVLILIAAPRLFQLFIRHT